MLTPVPCSGRRGWRTRCELPALHPGDHVRGDHRWARSAREAASFERSQQELQRLREQAAPTPRQEPQPPDEAPRGSPR